MADNTLSKWFPVTKQSWGINAVPLLAIMGEASIADNAQPMTASMLCLLPRILPAPQALLKPTRPSGLPTYTANVVGIYNGICLNEIRFFANIIHPLDEGEPYSFKVIEIKHAADNAGQKAKVLAKANNGNSIPMAPLSNSEGPTAEERPDHHAPTTNHSLDLESGNGHHARASIQAEPARGIQRRRTAKQKAADRLSNPILKKGERPVMPPALTSPIHVITIISFVMTLAIFGLAAYWRDTNALIAVFIISLQASLVGYASWWKPQLMTRDSNGVPVPPGDMLIRTSKSSFILVKCNEDVARELYTGPEQCEYYVGPKNYRILMAIATMLLMVGVVLLGNTKFNAQVVISASYILLNGAYWIFGMIPKAYFWDMTRYTCKDITEEDAKNADKEKLELAGVEVSPSFTRTLWYAIRETNGHTGWVERSGAAPST